MQPEGSLQCSQGPANSEALCKHSSAVALEVDMLLFSKETYKGPKVNTVNLRQRRQWGSLLLSWVLGSR
jgi:hypothetical protein